MRNLADQWEVSFRMRIFQVMMKLNIISAMLFRGKTTAGINSKHSSFSEMQKKKTQQPYAMRAMRVADVQRRKCLIMPNPFPNRQIYCLLIQRVSAGYGRTEIIRKALRHALKNCLKEISVQYLQFSIRVRAMISANFSIYSVQCFFIRMQAGITFSIMMN